MIIYPLPLRPIYRTQNTNTKQGYRPGTFSLNQTQTWNNLIPEKDLPPRPMYQTKRKTGTLTKHKDVIGTFPFPQPNTNMRWFCSRKTEMELTSHIFFKQAQPSCPQTKRSLKQLSYIGGIHLTQTPRLEQNLHLW